MLVTLARVTRTSRGLRRLTRPACVLLAAGACSAAMVALTVATAQAAVPGVPVPSATADPSLLAQVLAPVTQLLSPAAAPQQGAPAPEPQAPVAAAIAVAPTPSTALPPTGTVGAPSGSSAAPVPPPPVSQTAATSAATVTPSVAQLPAGQSGPPGGVTLAPATPVRAGDNIPAAPDPASARVGAGGSTTSGSAASAGAGSRTTSDTIDEVAQMAPVTLLTTAVLSVPARLLDSPPVQDLLGPRVTTPISTTTDDLGNTVVNPLTLDVDGTTRDLGLTKTLAPAASTTTDLLVTTGLSLPPDVGSTVTSGGSGNFGAPQIIWPTGGVTTFLPPPGGGAGASGSSGVGTPVGPGSGVGAAGTASATGVVAAAVAAAGTSLAGIAALLTPFGAFGQGIEGIAGTAVHTLLGLPGAVRRVLGVTVPGTSGSNETGAPLPGGAIAGALGAAASNPVAAGLLLLLLCLLVLVVLGLGVSAYPVLRVPR